MKLYGRLLVMAEFVKPGERIADIGTDHGFVPIFLYKNKLSPKVILTDVNKGPLETAKENFENFIPNSNPDLRLGNGLEPLNKGEIDTVIIAGMGGELIEKILKKDLEKSKSIKKFILQPRTRQAELRKFLYKYSFEIVEEKLVREGKYICQIIVARPSEKILDMPEEIDLEVSPLLFLSQDPLLEDFIKGKIKIEENIMNQIQSKASDKNLFPLDKARKRISLLENLLKKIGGSNGH